MAVGKEGNVKWVDGLRGIASFLVVVKHVTIAFFPCIMWPSISAEESPMWFEQPLIRVFFQGRIGVAIFSFVVGYVCCLKPIKCFHSGCQSKAFAAISKSAVRRVPRLVLPVALVLVLSCLAAQLGAFEIAKHSDGYGLDVTSPDYYPNWFDALQKLLQDEVRIWTVGNSVYGPELWTMLPIMKGAFWVYCYLLATANMNQKYRMMAALFLALYRWCANDAFFGMQFFFGAFMADLQNPLDAAALPVVVFLSPPRLHHKSWLKVVACVLFLLVGFTVASLPDSHHEWQAWSQNLADLLRATLPRDPDLPRSASALGLDLIVMSIHFSEPVRNALASKPFIWLGRMSFAVFLLHNQILRSVLCWMVYGLSLPPIPEGVQDSDSGECVTPDRPRLEFPGARRLFIVLPIFFAVVYGAAWLWTIYVDAWFAKLTEKLVGATKEDHEREKAGGRTFTVDDFAFAETS